MYSRLSEKLDGEIANANQMVAHIGREIEKLQSKSVLNKDIVMQALANFDDLFSVATDEEKRAMMRALIKEIYM